MPSYSSCATFMVRLAWKPNRREASCCKVEVIKGGAGFFCRVPIFILFMINGSFSAAAFRALACSSVVISHFLPPVP